MYRHLLVPVDGSALSMGNVRSAIELAAKLGAQVSFLHATADFGATSDGALIHAMDPALFERGALGETNAYLAKAVASARVAGVEYAALSCVSNRPAEAIVEAAVAQGADLIVMASRGVRGWESWLHSSQTERVLRDSSVALLVTRVGASDPLRADERALGVIYDEHSSIAVTMNSLRQLASSGAGLDASQRQQIRLLCGYLRDFPHRLHHPKEEAYLHRLLRHRHPACEPTLLELESQHVREPILAAAVESALAASESGSAANAEPGLRSAVMALTDAIGGHLRFEEASIFPLARTHLLDADWAEIASAFEANGDARFGDLGTADFQRLFVQIANITMQRDIDKGPA